VLLRLGCTPGSRRGPTPAPTRPPVDGDSARVLAAFAGEPATPDQLAHRCELGVAAVALALCALARDGWARSQGGHWWPT
jgi:predicted Rossmann fold nucleotide-binding protein DprA/Smf involved in DNA uptake